uniref:BTB domain-containing protein n=1 Tax=Mesocestoides corti TaxID=53468 RepID=A0A5K3F501_MESCO
MLPHFPMELDIPSNATRRSSSASPLPIQSSSHGLSPVSPSIPYSSHNTPSHSYTRSIDTSGEGTALVTALEAESPISSYSSSINLSQGNEYSLHLHRCGQSRCPGQLDLTSSAPCSLSNRVHLGDRCRLPDSVGFETPPCCNSLRRGTVTVSTPSSQHRLSYVSEFHSRNSLDAMNVLRKNKELCDVVLLVDSKKIYAHRVVLAASSPYFKAMFAGELAESRQMEVKLFDLDPNAVETLVNFCYTSRIQVEVKNVQALLPAACLLQMTEIKVICCEFLKRQLDPSNCLGIRAFADTHSCTDLLKMADRFVHQNFLEVVESEEFRLLPVSQLIELLSSDDLSVRGEEQVYLAVMRWLQHDLTSRQKHLPLLLQHVRLPLLTPKFLVDVVGASALVRSNEFCRDLIDEAKNYLLLPQERSRMQGPRTRPRKPVAFGEALFAVGGWCSGDAIASAERYDPRTHEWTLVAPMNKQRCGVGVGVVNDLLYAVGGHDGQSYLNSVERYDPHTNMWSADVAPTNTCRTSVGVAVLDSFLYAVGGQDGVTCLNLVERYDPVINKWTKVANMSTRRLGVGVAVINGQLYAVGGSDSQHPLATVEHYDPRVGSWYRIASMSARRKHLGVAAFGGFIYAVGGRDDSTELSSAECYDVRANAWCPVVAMTSRRSGVGLTVIRNQLIAIGGFDGASYLKSVEVYDPDSACWRLQGSMNSRRLGGGVGVVRLASYPGCCGDANVIAYDMDTAFEQFISLRHHHHHHHQHHHQPPPSFYEVPTSSTSIPDVSQSSR